MKKIQVGVGAMIFNNHQELLMQLRGAKANNEVGKWEIPGGKVEFGEKIEVAIKREMMEEIGVEIEVIKLFRVADHILPDENQHWISPTLVCKIVKGEPKNMEPHKIDEIRWVSIAAAKKLPLSVVTKDDIAALAKLSKAELKKLAS